MIVCTTPAQMQAATRQLRNVSRRLGFVPTMGALHAGHLSLVSAARADCDAVTASIFVNPAQFGPNEDYETYPRNLEEDSRRLEAAGVHLLFAPSAADMYPPGNTTFVDPGEIANRLDGASRPGHFRGVATIVSRLFHIVAPDRAYFGQKDAAQVAVIRRLIRDLNFPVRIVICPIYREPDGLAMSSRNRCLSSDERPRALILSRALNAAKLLVSDGETDARRLRDSMLAIFANDPQTLLEYADVVDPDTLLPIADTRNGALLAVSAWVGTTRLIDNLRLSSEHNGEPVTDATPRLDP